MGESATVYVHGGERAGISQESQVSILRVSVPFIQPCQLVLALVCPWIAPLEVVLVVKAATHVAPSRDPTGDVLPFHAFASQLDEDDIFLGGPSALSLCG